MVDGDKYTNTKAHLGGVFYFSLDGTSLSSVASSISITNGIVATNFIATQMGSFLYLKNQYITTVNI